MRKPRATEWADYAAGKLSAARRRALDERAASDPEQAAERERALRVRESFEEMAECEAPELAWDALGARIHWELSLARRQSREGATRSRRRWLVPAAALTAAAAAALALVWWQIEPDAARAVVPEPAVDRPEVGEVIPVQHAAEPVFGLVTLVEGQASRDGLDLTSDQLDGAISAGAVLATGEGRLAVQFDHESAFELGPQSSVQLVRFDRREIILASRGTIDIQVTKRRPGQRFVVRAAGARVEVRGTRFQVDDRAGRLAVSCTRGAVAVDLAGGASESVPAGKRLSAAGVDATLVALDADELRELDERLDVAKLPEWDASWDGSGPHPSAFLGIDEPKQRSVAVDGIEVGTAPMRLRVAPGRHHVASLERGAWSKGTWVKLAAREKAVAVLPAPAAKPDRSRARSRRRRDLISRIEQAPAVRGCVRGLAKRGLAEGAFFEFEIGVTGDGTPSFLNMLSSDLPRPVSACVRGAVDRVDFGTGPAVELRHRLRF